MTFASETKNSSGLFSDLKNVRFAPDILFATPFLDGPKQKQALLSVIDLKTKGQTESLASYAQRVRDLDSQCFALVREKWI